MKWKTVLIPILLCSQLSAQVFKLNDFYDYYPALEQKVDEVFNSLNDTEVAAGYISSQLSQNKSLKETLTESLKDLDGFYTFIAGTKNGFAVLRDEIACKPAVIAENEDYVAIASEFQAMAHLPNVNKANIFEPQPGIVYVWEKK